MKKPAPKSPAKSPKKKVVIVVAPPMVEMPMMPMQKPSTKKKVKK